MAEEKLLDDAEIEALQAAAALDKTSAPAGGPFVVDEPVEPFEIAHAGKAVTPSADRLKLINERFQRHFAATLLKHYKSPVDVGLEPVQFVTFADLRTTLESPVSINVLKFSPLRGVVLCAFDWRLLFTLVDRYFGGPGTLPEAPASTEVTPAEQRVAEALLRFVLDSLFSAWRPELELDIQHQSVEFNPRFAVIPGVSELERLVLTEFSLTFDQGAGSIRLAFPEDMLDQLQAIHSTPIEGDGPASESTMRAWQECIRSVPLEFESTLLTTTVSLQKLLSLKPGDVLTIDLPETIDLKTEKVPLLRGTCGEADGFRAVRISTWLDGQL